MQPLKFKRVGRSSSWIASEGPDPSRIVAHVCRGIDPFWAWRVIAGPVTASGTTRTRNAAVAECQRYAAAWLRSQRPPESKPGKVADRPYPSVLRLDGAGSWVSGESYHAVRRELGQAYANLTRVQERCTEILEENRRLKSELLKGRHHVDAALSNLWGKP